MSNKSSDKKPLDIPELNTKCSYNSGSDVYGSVTIKHDDEDYPIIYRKKYRIRVKDFRDREKIFEWHPTFQKWCRICDDGTIGIKNRIIFHTSARTPISVLSFDVTESFMDPCF